LTTTEQIELMREFTVYLEGTGIITDAWVDDWDDYGGFSFGVGVAIITPYSTNSVKATIRRALELQEFSDIDVDLVNYNAPRRVSRYQGAFTQYHREYWMFSARA